MIEISKSVNYIGENAFLKCCNIERILVDNENKFYDSREDSNCLIETSTNKLLTGSKIGIIPSGITFIDNHIFTR